MSQLLKKKEKSTNLSVNNFKYQLFTFILRYTMQSTSTHDEGLALVAVFKN